MNRMSRLSNFAVEVIAITLTRLQQVHDMSNMKNYCLGYLQGNWPYP